MYENSRQDVRGLGMGTGSFHPTPRAPLAPSPSHRPPCRQTLRHATNLTINFNMAAQFDHKAQWLSWVPFDHYWDDGKIWRCAKLPLAVKVGHMHISTPILNRPARAAP